MLKEAISSDAAPKAIGPYSSALRAGNLLFVSGQVPFDPATGEIVGGDIGVQTRRVLDNIGAVLRSAGASFDDVVRVGVYVRDMADRERINTVRRCYFGESRPASTLVEVSGLAHPGALVEIEAVALLPRRDGHQG